VCKQGKYAVTLIAGDGIGPEIGQSVKDIFTEAKVRRGFLYRYPLVALARCSRVVSELYAGHPYICA
jgi:isocitrate/isopropylmalate dehydrogenase